MFAFDASMSITVEMVTLGGNATMNFVSVFPVFKVNVLAPVWKAFVGNARTCALFVTDAAEAPKNRMKRDVTTKSEELKVDTGEVLFPMPRHDCVAPFVFSWMVVTVTACVPSLGVAANSVDEVVLLRMSMVGTTPLFTVMPQVNVFDPEIVVPTSTVWDWLFAKEVNTGAT
jgi:hypothetical protein